MLVTDVAGHNNTLKIKLNKYVFIMESIELRSNLHKMVDRIEDEQLLRSIYSLLKKRESSEDGLMWKQLTDEQKKEVLQAYEESEVDENLIDDDDIWKNFK